MGSSVADLWSYHYGSSLSAFRMGTGKPDADTGGIAMSDKEVKLADLLAEYDIEVLRKWLREQEKEQDQESDTSDKPSTK